MASCTGILKVLLPILVALYGVFYWHAVASRIYYTGEERLDGKTVIVTGGNSGIGKETALDLARRGARVILACRNVRKAEDVAKEIKAQTGNSEVLVRPLDLGSLQSVRDFSSQIMESEERLDILINNAGVASDEQAPGVVTTADGFDFTFGINHFGHFLLTNLLLDLLRKTAPSRVVAVSSVLHNYSPDLNFTAVDTDMPGIRYPHLKAYQASKLANVVFASELAKREASNGIVATSLHPGVIFTPIWKTHMLAESRLKAAMYYASIPFMWLLFIDEKAGAQTTLHCALDSSIPDLSGGYFDNCQEVQPSPLAQDDELARQLWDVSCHATGLKC